MKKLVIDATVENLSAVLDFINKELEERECPLKLQTQINIAAEEVFINIANYAYTPEIGSVSVGIAVDNKISIEFEDSGIPYNPLEKPDPEITSSASEREVGGLGIFMVKKIMDSVEYSREGSKNILTIQKAIT